MQRGAARGGQRGHGRFGSSWHRPHRHALHRAQTLGGDKESRRRLTRCFNLRDLNRVDPTLQSFSPYLVLAVLVFRLHVRIYSAFGYRRRTRNDKISVSEPRRNSMKLPPEQEAIRAKCFHPSGTFVQFPREDIDKSIPERFEDMVSRYPDRLAVSTKERQLTYEQLNRRANRLAHYIRARQGTAQEPVGLFLDHWADLVIAHLAVLKSGKFSLALDPKADINRTSHLLVDSGAQIVIVGPDTDKSLRALVTGKSAVINVNDPETSFSDDNPNVPISPEAYAYIRYTSGST